MKSCFVKKNYINLILSSLLSLILVLPAISQNDAWHISVGKVENYTGVVSANGRLGILSSDRPFETESIIMNNVYDFESPDGVSKILSGINFANLDLEIDGEKITENNISNWKQTLDMRRAAFTTNFRFKNKAEISYTIYTLRQVQYTGYIDISIEPLKDININVTGKIITPEDYNEVRSNFEVLKDLETTMPILQTVAKSIFGKHIVASSATFVWHDINSTNAHERPELIHKKNTEYNNHLSFTKELKAGNTFEFAWTGALTSTQDFEDPKTESERFVIFNLLMTYLCI